MTRGGGRYASDGMQASLWLPLLVAMLIVALVVEAATYAVARKVRVK